MELVVDADDVLPRALTPSPTFGKWVGAELSAENHHQLWIPVGFDHGFLTLTPTAEVLYKASGFWNKACESSIRWDDPDLAVA